MLDNGRMNNLMALVKFIFPTALIMKELSPMDLSMDKVGLYIKEEASMKAKPDTMLLKGKAYW